VLEGKVGEIVYQRLTCESIFYKQVYENGIKIFLI